jgi:hypothetical protein
MAASARRRTGAPVERELPWLEVWFAGWKSQISTWEGESLGSSR